MRQRCVYVGGQVRPLRLFEVLARNSQSALGRFGGILRAREQPPRVFTIPPRQRLPFTTRLAIRTWRAAHIVIIIIYIILNTHTFYILNTHVHFLKIFFSQRCKKVRKDFLKTDARLARAFTRVRARKERDAVHADNPFLLSMMW